MNQTTFLQFLDGNINSTRWKRKYGGDFCKIAIDKKIFTIKFKNLSLSKIKTKILEIHKGLVNPIPDNENVYLIFASGLGLIKSLLKNIEKPDSISIKIPYFKNSPKLKDYLIAGFEKKLKYFRCEAIEEQGLLVFVKSKSILKKLSPKPKTKTKKSETKKTKKQSMNKEIIEEN